MSNRPSVNLVRSVPDEFAKSIVLSPPVVCADTTGVDDNRTKSNAAGTAHTVRASRHTDLALEVIVGSLVLTKVKRERVFSGATPPKRPPTGACRSPLARSRPDRLGRAGLAVNGGCEGRSRHEHSTLIASVKPARLVVPSHHACCIRRATGSSDAATTG